MTDEADPAETTDAKRAALLARLDDEMRKAMRSIDEGRGIDAGTAFGHLEVEIEKAPALAR